MKNKPKAKAKKAKKSAVSSLVKTQMFRGTLK